MAYPQVEIQLSDTSTLIVSKLRPGQVSLEISGRFGATVSLTDLEVDLLRSVLMDLQ